MKLNHPLLCAPLMLYGAPVASSNLPSHAKGSFSNGSLRGVFNAMADDAKAKYASPSDISGAANDGETPASAFGTLKNGGEIGNADPDTPYPTFFPTSSPTEDTAANSEYSASTFGTTLFSELCMDSSYGNVLLSPLSVHKALMLVKDGATIGSDNEAELEKVLGPPYLIEQTEEDDDGDASVQLTMTSSIWANMLKQSYVDEAMAKHSAEAFPLPLRYTPIDEWIEDKTNGMIKGFLGNDRIPGDIVALLVNAVYFKGTWTYEFDPELTVDGDFILRNETGLPARFMTATRKMELIQESPALGGASAVMLDYGKNSSDPTEFTSLFILPATSDTESMDSVISGLKSQSMTDLLGEASETKGDVKLKLPRFRLDFGPSSLKPVLEKMGMEIAFDDHIDDKFDEMSYDSSLTVDDVLHGAVMEVTEEGTEASATTVVPMRNRSRPRPPPELTFDRPFVVAVIHRATGTPVFMGRVEEPELDF